MLTSRVWRRVRRRVMHVIPKYLRGILPETWVPTLRFDSTCSPVLLNDPIQSSQKDSTTLDHFLNSFNSFMASCLRMALPAYTIHQVVTHAFGSQTSMLRSTIGFSQKTNTPRQPPNFSFKSTINSLSFHIRSRGSSLEG